MDEIQILIGTAEIGVAVAGFASLASILGRRYSRDDPKVDAARLRSMLEISLATAGLSLLPILPMKLGVSEESVWRLSSVAFLLSLVAMSLAIHRRNRGLIRVGAAFNRAFNATSFGVAAALALVLLASAFAIGGSAIFATYYAALLLNLAFAGLLFIRIISSLLAAPPP